MASDAHATLLWAIVAGLAVGTYAIRLSFLLLFGRIEEVPERLQRVLRYVAPAVLAALAIPGVLYVGDALAGPAHAGRLVAGVVGTAVAWRTESILATVSVGMATYWLFQLVG